MSDHQNPPTAKVRRSRGIAFVWIVPIVAFAVVAWLGFKTLLDRGPLVTITFESAQGLEAGRTQVRYKGINVGTVETVKLAPDLTSVVVTARLDRSVADVVTSSTSFWVARPRLSPAGISGLTTLVSGSYVEMEPGRSGDPQYEFKGLEDPPILPPPQPGRRFLLKSDKLGGLGSGSPVYYHGVDVGEVLGFDLAPGGDGVRIYLFIRSPYDTYVHADTKFWNAGGFSISAGAQGLRAKMESLQALISGGVAFDGDAKPPAATAAKPDAEFSLYSDESDADADPKGLRVHYLVRMPGLVRGLNVGAEVDLKGIAVGQVTGVTLTYDMATNEVATPATIEIYPERISFGSTPVPTGAAAQGFFDDVLRKLVDAGLHARLASGNLLTGQRIVSLEMDHDDPPGHLEANGDQLMIPTTDGGDLDSLSHSASQVMKKISAMPLEEIGKSVRNIVDHLDKITASADVKQSIHSLNEALQNLSQLTHTANVDLPPLLASVRQTADAATKTLNALGGQGGRGADLPALMHELTEAARSLRSLSDFLQEHPEALIKGKTGADQ